jgi:hypothetical protein
MWEREVLLLANSFGCHSEEGGRSSVREELGNMAEASSGWDQASGGLLWGPEALLGSLEFVFICRRAIGSMSVSWERCTHCLIFSNTQL